MDQKRVVSIWYFALMVLAMFYLQGVVTKSIRIDPVSYSEMLHLLDTEQIEEVDVDEQYIRGKLKSTGVDGRQYVKTPRMDTDLVKLLSRYNVEYKGIIESHFIANLLSWVVPMAIFIGIWFFIMRRMSGSQGGLGGMTAKPILR